ncbi:MAG TPA: energy transducer TonB [Ignavibacteriaceae bacterium]|nr:energy transducer TonB [Ignavibacterium sp.]HMN25589.1 energy transducer TonB [Ignavibacteriaceae bacterium]HRP91392.1 energy transducer TonB [Ignavibacteriaceae bacterium]
MNPFFYLSLFLCLIISSNLFPQEKKPNLQGEEYHIKLDEMPDPIGGIEAIQSKVIYPKEAKEQGVQGKVYILAFINEKGIVDSTKIIKGIGGGCDEAAMNAIKQIKFKPGRQKGIPMKAQVAIPIIFKLD